MREDKNVSEQKTITVKLDPEDHRKVKVLAAEMGITIKDLLLRCVDRLREEHDKAKCH
jgi:predicted HicB family RNase H-like nuclease